MSSSPFHGIFSGLKTGVSKKKNDVSAGQVIGQTSGAAGRIAVDIYEEEGYYIVRAPIAGVRLSDLDIEVNDNILILRGTRQKQDDIPADQFFVQECFWGTFERKVTFPGPIDARKIKATFNRDCVLKILVPKEEKAVKVVRINEG
jgi:HSP20 family protein